MEPLRDNPFFDLPQYPVMLQLTGRSCVVIGGGVVATRKINNLLEYGAEVTVVSPTLTTSLWRLVQAGTITHLERHYTASDVQGALLVFAATDEEGINEGIATDANEAGALVNVAHAPECSDFTNPGVLRHGQVQISVSTGGASPTLTRRVLNKLSQLVDDRLSDLAGHLMDARHQAQLQFADTQTRHMLLRQFADACWTAWERDEPLPDWQQWQQAQTFDTPVSQEDNFEVKGI
ncbi:precorrin-2 dehydrogenase/sirohydrochlorin ferrochelatase family protein [Paenibacillus sp. 481]|uniref:precorrin-2 dehydrogenase/sirohydrochlorin ferrochelatase family protein n=1 Tax=Paenibacillus sp. 481 TaxID=2835869 RepID=UPI001E442701|nr:bifunctional precorrin-2 dehydrogenase/sirohydrochlorin ferrochelatase [Paenibacillus sp. 481]UHA74372.1 bifunctional precorrin-2 dehydrogenase/sirohydrochlorin ferrochelatase [Paenibacillus sp. 481]